MDSVEYMNGIDDYAIESPRVFDVDIKTRHIITFFILGLILSAVSGIKDTSGQFFVAARVILASLLVISAFMRVSRGVPLFFMLVLVGPDMMQMPSERAVFGEYNTASVWRLYIGPLRPSWIIFGFVVIHIIRTMNFAMDRHVRRATIWFLTVPVLTGLIYGGYRTYVWTIEVPKDLRFGMMLISSIVLFHGFLRKHPESLGITIAVFLGSILGRHLCDLIYWILGYGPKVGGIPRASVDSAKSAVILLLLLSIYLVVKRGKFLLGSVIGIGSALLIIVYGTRLIWVTAALCCMALLYVFGARRAIIAVPLILILAVGSSKLSRAMYGGLGEATEERAQRMAFAKEEIGNYLERLDPIRYTEMLNSIHTSIKRMALFWGNGYGSYYLEELVPFPRNLIDAHPEHTAITGRFYYCHNYLLEVLFKHGIVGLIIITALWVGPARECYREVFDRASPNLFNGLLGCFIAFIPNAIICLYWSGKSVLVSGFVIAVLTVAVEQHRKLQTEEYSSYTDLNITDELSTYRPVPK